MNLRIVIIVCWVDIKCICLQLCEEQLAVQMEEEARRNAWTEPEVTSQISLSNVNITASVNGSASPEASVLRRER